MLALWILCLTFVALALWSDVGNPITLWRKTAATALLVAASASAILWLCRKRLQLSLPARAMAALACVVPVILVLPLLRTPDGAHIASSYRQAREMAAELESVMIGTVHSYRQWHIKRQTRRADYEYWFPSIAQRVRAAEHNWGYAFGNWMASQASRDPKAALEELAAAHTTLSGTPVFKYVEGEAENIRAMAVKNIAADLTRMAWARPEQAISDIEKTEVQFRDHVVSPSLGLKLGEVRMIAVQAWAAGEIQRLTSLARDNPDAALEQLDKIATQVPNAAVVDRIMHRIPAVRELAEFRKSLQNVRRQNQRLIAEAKYKEALAAADRLQTDLRAKAKSLNLEQELDKLVDEYAFLVDLHQLAERSGP
jgi:hypothetical protein